MMFWIGLMLITLLITVVALLFLSTRFARFSWIQQRFEGRKRIQNLMGFLITIIITGICAFLWNTVNAVMITLHLLVIWMLCDGAAVLYRKFSGKITGKRYYSGIVAILLTIVWLCIGAYQAFHVWEKDYKISTDKTVGNLRVALIADSHVGATFDGEGLEKHLQSLQAAKPDVFVIAGDFVDDDSTKEDMIRSCQALGSVKTRYGTYFSFGNHDKGYYNGRGYSGEELMAELGKNGVTVLQDEAVLLDQRFYILGRQDASEDNRGNDRKNIAQLAGQLQEDCYSIVLNHQPTDYDQEAQAGVDLVLSGHTHGGQFFPVNLVSQWLGINDKVYGHEKRENTDFIVSSGISDWAILFKTGCRSEYVIIDIEGKK